MSNRWTESEVKVLREKYGEIQASKIACNLAGRSVHSVREKARSLDLAGSSPDKWSDEEIDILKEKYRHCEKEGLKSMLPKRSWSGIASKAHDIGIQRMAQEKKVAEKTLDLTEEKSSYIAGVVDCDGSITIYKSKNSSSKCDFILKPEIKISNNSYKLIEEISSQLEIYQITEDNRSKCKYLSIEGKACLPLAKEIKPYLVAKREQCTLLIEWCESRLNRSERYGDYKERELKIQRKIQELNN